MLAGLFVAAAASAILFARGEAPFGDRPIPVSTDPLAALIGGVLLLGSLVGIVGLALYVVVPGLNPALARRDFDRIENIVASLLAVFVLGNLLPLPAILLLRAPPFGAESAPSAGLTAPTLVIAMFATQLALMVVLVWRIVRPGVISWDEMGLTPRNLSRRVQQGVVGAIGIFLLAAAVGLTLRALGVEQTQAELFRPIRSASQPQLISFFLMAAVVAPICEEAFFRGYIFGALRGRYGRLAAYSGSSLLFAAIHLNLPALVPILVMACGLAFLYDRSQSIVPGIIAHGLNNGLALLALYGGAAG